MSLLNYMIENEQKPKRIWLFGVILFGYLAQIPMTTRGRLSLARRTLSSFWRRWGIRMSLWSCMIDALIVFSAKKFLEFFLDTAKLNLSPNWVTPP